MLKAVKAKFGKVRLFMKKTVVITGGAKGIGAALCRGFANAGWNVVIGYCTSEEKARMLAGETGALCIAVDVRHADRCEKLIQFALERFGGIDLLINNAGIAGQKLFTDISEEEWDNMFAVNVKGAYNCTKAVMPHFIHKKQGNIINISSIWGMVGASCEVHYSASKAALIGFTKALAKEVAPSGIRVNCIAPGIVQTDMMSCFTEDEIDVLKEETPLMKLGRGEDIARAALYLAEDEFMTGQVISPNGGFVI